VKVGQKWLIQQKFVRVFNACIAEIHDCISFIRTASAAEALVNTHPLTRSTQPCIAPGSLNRVPASAGGKGGNVTSAGWQVTLCDRIWHVSSRSGVATLRTAIHLLLTYLLFI